MAQGIGNDSVRTPNMGVAVSRTVGNPTAAPMAPAQGEPANLRDQPAPVADGVDATPQRTTLRQPTALAATDPRAQLAPRRARGVSTGPQVASAHKPSSSAARSAPIDQAKVTAQLLKQLSVYKPQGFEPGTPYWEVSRDPALVEFAAMHFSRVEEALAKARAEAPAEPFFVDRTHTALALTLATHGEVDPANVRGLALQKEIVAKYGALADDAGFRSNCYAYAVGDLTNPTGLGAQPGHKGLGLVDYDPTDIKALLRGAVADGLRYAGADPSKLKLPEGHRLVMLYVSDEGQDFHWERIDRSTDGKLQASGKYGMEQTVHVTELNSIYDHMAWDFGHGYKFKAFFYVPEAGMDVGLDAHYRAQGQMSPTNTPPNGTLDPDKARQVNVEFLQALLANNK